MCIICGKFGNINTRKHSSFYADSSYTNFANAQYIFQILNTRVTLDILKHTWFITKIAMHTNSRAFCQKN